MEKFEFTSFLSHYKWRIICVVIGIVVTMLLINIGFWNTILLAALVAVGLVIGAKLDAGSLDGLKSFFSKWIK